MGDDERSWMEWRERSERRSGLFYDKLIKEVFLHFIQTIESYTIWGYILQFVSIHQIERYEMRGDDEEIIKCNDFEMNDQINTS